MSQFAELEALVSAEIDDLYGEPTLIEPMAKTSRYFAGSADGNRAGKNVIGIVDFNPVTLISQDKGKYDGLRPAVAADKIHVSYDETKFPDWRPQEGDVIVLTERASERLVVTRTDPDGIGRFVCVCARAASET